MAYTIVITKKAKRDIDNLEPIIKNRLGKKLKQVMAMDDISQLSDNLWIVGLVPTDYE
ncbi:MAG: hypothetical protein R3B53_01630 [Candidatus Paceibacterota bacterium]